MNRNTSTSLPDGLRNFRADSLTIYDSRSVFLCKHLPRPLCTIMRLTCRREAKRHFPRRYCKQQAVNWHEACQSSAWIPVP